MRNARKPRRPRRAMRDYGAMQRVKLKATDYGAYQI